MLELLVLVKPKTFGIKATPHVFGLSHGNGYVEQSENCLKKLIEKVGLPTVKVRAVAKKATWSKV